MLVAWVVDEYRLECAPSYWAVYRHQYYVMGKDLYRNVMKHKKAVGFTVLITLLVLFALVLGIGYCCVLRMQQEQRERDEAEAEAARTT